jgi:vacuolar-type H+-ATPase subunit D/Vma8
MDLQHKVNYNQFKENRDVFNDMKDLFEKRHSDLTDRFQVLEKEHKELNMKYNRLVVVHASYRKLNKELVFEVE